MENNNEILSLVKDSQLDKAQTEALAKLNLTKEEIPQKVVAIFEDLTQRDLAVQNSQTKANEAKTKASSLKEKEYPFFGKKKAEIEDLQEVVIALGNAQVDSATAENELLIYQDKLAEASRYLFGIGIAGLSANRMIIRELELKLKNASKEQLSSLATKELESVLRQLKAQEDTFVRLEKQEETLQVHKKKLAELNELLSQKADYSQLENSLSKAESVLCDKFNEQFKQVGIASESLNQSMKKQRIIMTVFIVVSWIISLSALSITLFK